MSLLKEQIADKGKSGPRGRVNCTGFLDEVINSIYSGDIWSLLLMIQGTHNSWVFLPAFVIPSSPVTLHAIAILNMQLWYQPRSLVEMEKLKLHFKSTE